jgi:lipopolysaccharide transport system permease protein
VISEPVTDRSGIAGSERVVRIKPHEGWRLPDFREMVSSRELLAVFIRRNIKVRYKQTALGASWAVLQPIMGTIVFTVFFNHLAKVPSQNNIPYPLLALSGLVPWNFFSNGFTQASDSLVSGATLVSKVYFPRMLVPLAAVLAGSLDFIVTLSLLLIVMGGYGRVPSANIVWLPVFVVMLVVVTATMGIFSATINARYRDVRYLVPFLSQTWLFLTPIVYPSTLFHGAWRTIIGLNPMVGVVEGFHWSVLGATPGPGLVLIPSVLVTAGMLLLTLFYFGRVERTLADVV